MVDGKAAKPLYLTHKINALEIKLNMQTVSFDHKTFCNNNRVRKRKGNWG
jgi:hypothetical protein